MADHRTVLLLPGHGAQCERMAAGLYGTQPEFTEHLDATLAALGDEGVRLRSQWLRPAPNPTLDDAATGQPLLFAVGYALGRAAQAAGRVDCLVGHSVGELVAACLAGVFAAHDMVRLVVARSRTLGDTGRGTMLAVAATPADLSARLPPGVVLAAVNGPRQTVVAGSDTAVEAARQRLCAAGFTVRALRSRHAFHSPLMAGTADRFARDLAGLPAGAPRGTVLSTRTGCPVEPAQAGDPRFWADQLVAPVRYWPALKSLLDSEGTGPGLLLLDASADRSLSVAARHHPAVRRGASRVVPLLAGVSQTGGPADVAAFTAAVRSLTAAQA